MSESTEPMTATELLTKLRDICWNSCKDETLDDLFKREIKAIDNWRKKLIEWERHLVEQEIKNAFHNHPLGAHNDV